MKTCAACSQELPKDKFSKKQWQSKQRRRCKDCIAENREVEASNDTPLSVGGADDEGASSWSDEDLFKQSPPTDECPICMLPLPIDDRETTYFSCCGKVLCSGCVHAHRTADNRNLCPFCRTPAPTLDREYIESTKKRADSDDVWAIYSLGCYYDEGEYGLQQNQRKAMKLWFRAGGLGHATAYNNVGYAYEHGDGVERDMTKAKYYYELAAMRGNRLARHNIGCLEESAGNMNRATKHWMISVGAGYDKSLKEIRQCFLEGHATKDCFEKALRTHKEAKDAMKSDQRDVAAAVRGQN